jgi:hypothetical protein
MKIHKILWKSRGNVERGRVMPWVCVADRQMVVFQGAVEECLLSELGFNGSKFTWCNNQMDHNFTNERLDRAVANSGWCENFGVVEVMVLAARNYDHCLILVTYGNGGRFI